MSKKILIVEDDSVMRKLLLDAFIKAGFEAREAENGEEGLKIATEFKPDGIVLDMMMPVMGGLETLEKLRQEEWGREIPVTILTNSSDISLVADALEKGVCKYIIKSEVAIDDIVDRVAKEIK